MVIFKPAIFQSNLPTFRVSTFYLLKCVGACSWPRFPSYLHQGFEDTFEHRLACSLSTRLSFWWTPGQGNGKRWKCAWLLPQSGLLQEVHPAPKPGAPLFFEATSLFQFGNDCGADALKNLDHDVEVLCIKSCYQDAECFLNQESC